MDIITKEEIKVYLLPGMGADHRLFSRLHLTGPDPQVLQWVPPEEKDSLGDYARRLLAQIAAPENAVLLGVSLGGMLAVELAKIAHFRKTILVSSVKTYRELPFYFRRAGKAGWHHWITAERLVRLRRTASPLMNHLGAEYRLFGQMLNGVDPRFMSWSLDAVLRWENEEVPPGLVHIHGTADLLLPARYISGYIPIRSGSHLMIYQKAGELNKLLHEII